MSFEIKEKFPAEAGYFEDGLPYAKIGNKPKILLNIEGLSFEQEPPSGFMFSQFKKSNKLLLDDYTVYQVGRKPNMPDNYLMDKMAEDYANMIRREFNDPIDVMGISTGGQIAHYLAADHPDTVRKLVIISAAYRLSETGVDIEKRAAEWFQKGKYGKSLAVIMEMIHPKGFKGRIYRFLGKLIGKVIIGKPPYPNDFLVEIQADREMNFRDRLGEIKAPTLILSGDQDISYTKDDVSITAEGIPNSELKLYKVMGITKLWLIGNKYSMIHKNS